MGSTGRRERRAIGRSVTISFEIAATQDMSSSLHGHRCLDIFALCRRINSCEMHNMEILHNYLFLPHRPKKAKPPLDANLSLPPLSLLSARITAELWLRHPCNSLIDCITDIHNISHALAS